MSPALIGSTHTSVHLLCTHLCFVFSRAYQPAQCAPCVYHNTNVRHTTVSQYEYETYDCITVVWMSPWDDRCKVYESVRGNTAHQERSEQSAQRCRHQSSPDVTYSIHSTQCGMRSKTLGYTAQHTKHATPHANTTQRSTHTRHTCLHASVAEHSGIPPAHTLHRRASVLCRQHTDTFPLLPTVPCPLSPVPVLSPPCALLHLQHLRGSAAISRAASAAISGGAPGRVHVDTAEQGCVCVV